MKIFNIIKKMVIIFSALAIAGVLTSCNVLEDEVVTSLGKYEKYEFFTSGGFQDYTDYAKYYYNSAEIEGNTYLKKVKETDLSTINRYLDDFEEWIETIKENDASSEVVVNYDFDRAIIDIEDYIYIESEETEWEDNYNIYFFDNQTQVMYYFHNNI